MSAARDAVAAIRDKQRDGARIALINATQTMLPLLAGRYTAEQWAELMLGALTDSPKLLDCTPVSLIRAFRTCAQAGFVPNGADGLCYVIPYGDVATFSLSYKGLLALVHRATEVLDVQADLVYSGDEFVYSRGTNPFVQHKPQVFATDRGTILGAYAMVRTVAGGTYVTVLSLADLESVRRRSASPDKGPWQSDKNAMYLKTVVRRVCNYLPKIWIPEENGNDGNALAQGLAEGDNTETADNGKFIGEHDTKADNQLLAIGGVDSATGELLSSGQGS